MTDGAFYLDVRGCARCGGDHDHLLAKHMERPVICIESHGKWEYFATCPKTSAPILLSRSEGGT